MPYWHQKNELCYNSRLSSWEFQCLIADYCQGISAQEASKRFMNSDQRNLSRQTIAKYFRAISFSLIDERKTYPWWSINYYDMSAAQINDIRNVVYDNNRIVSKLRGQIGNITGSYKSVDNKTYIDVLRRMSKDMNGLPKGDKFCEHLIRACEIAFFIEMGFSDPTEVMYRQTCEHFWFTDRFLFRRKASPTTCRERDERHKQKKTDEWIYALNSDDFKPDLALIDARKKWKSLNTEGRELNIQKRYLSAFDSSMIVSDDIAPAIDSDQSFPVRSSQPAPKSDS